MDRTTTFLGIPTHNGQLYAGVGEDASTAGRSVIKGWGTSSLIPKTFGQLWCMAVNMADDGKVTHFAMQHSDIIAEPGWLDILHDEMERRQVDLIGVVMPIKDERGLTSMGIDIRREPELTFRNISMREVDTLPETFTARDVREGKNGQGDLVLNTGLWLCKLNKPWNKKVCFQISCWIEWDDPKYPRGHLCVEPEDWYFSRQLITMGVPICATRKVRARHMGTTAYENQGAWGSIFYDDGGRVRSAVPGYDANYRLPGGYGDEDKLAPKGAACEDRRLARPNLGFSNPDKPEAA